MHIIALDTSFLYTDIGFGTYTDGLVRFLPGFDRQIEWHFLSNDLPAHVPAFAPITENRKTVQYSFPENVRQHSTRTRRRIVWSNTSLPRYLKRNHVDLFHSVDNISLPLLSKPCSMVLTLHDLIPLLLPDLVEPKNAVAARWLMPRVVRQADRIICVSKATRNDLLSFFPDAEEKAVVIESGVDMSRFYPLDERDRRAKLVDLKNRYRIREGYILSLASLNPRRNLQRLLAAFGELRRAGDGKDRQLVIGGVWDYGSELLRDEVAARGLEDDVIFLGHVPRGDVAGLYQCAACTVCVSLYEGFGFPVLESLACGTPVVASRSSSLPEVGGRVTIYVDPLDSTDIARGIALALQDDCQESREDRVDWASGFRWDVTALKTYRLYRELLVQ